MLFHHTGCPFAAWNILLGYSVMWTYLSNVEPCGSSQHGPPILSPPWWLCVPANYADHTSVCCSFQGRRTQLIWELRGNTSTWAGWKPYLNYFHGRASVWPSSSISWLWLFIVYPPSVWLPRSQTGSRFALVWSLLWCRAEWTIYLQNFKTAQRIW